MKRTPVLVLAAAALVATSPTALAAARKPATPKPIAMTFHLHGGQSNGNLETLPSAAVDGPTSLPMNATAPTGTSAKETATWAAVATPNSDCDDGPVLATWRGPVKGFVSGTVKVDFFARGLPGNLVVRLIADGDGCNADFVPPFAEATVAAPSSPTPAAVSVTMTLAKPVKLATELVLQIIPAPGPGGQFGPGFAGVSYDATTADSKVSFSCTPKPGRKTC